MKLIDQQKQLMQKALDLLKQIQMVYTMFSGHTKNYADERAQELKDEYAATITQLVEITTNAALDKLVTLVDTSTNNAFFVQTAKYGLATGKTTEVIAMLKDQARVTVQGVENAFGYQITELLKIL